MTQPEPYDHMETEPASIADPIERARLVFQQWHTDEVTDGPAALDYANRLVDRLAEHGLTIILEPTDGECSGS